MFSRIRSFFGSVHSESASNKNRTYANILNQLEACVGTIAGAELLEVGCDPKGNNLQYLASERRLRKAVGVNIALADNIENSKYSLLKADARNLPFEDNSFDIIISVSAFEHIHDFDAALAEMFRVLKKGGHLFSEFAPIWSGVWGHHLWLDHDGETRNWKNTPLPPYAHLVMEERELEAWILEKYQDPLLCRKILNYVYRSEDQNRLFYNDFENVVDKSSFKKVFFVGLSDLPPRKGYETEKLEQVIDLLQQKYPEKSGFGYLGISMLLSKVLE